MEIDRKVFNVIINSLHHNFDDFCYLIKSKMVKLEQARTVEEIMEIKQDILHSWIYELPIGDQNCYFCNDFVHNLNCNNCSYKKIHGDCNDTDSSYSLICDAQDSLLELIDNEYYKGENYE